MLICVCSCSPWCLAPVLQSQGSPCGIEVGRTSKLCVCLCLCVRALILPRCFPPPSFPRRILRVMPRNPSVTPVEALARPYVCVCVCVCRHHDCAPALRPRDIEVSRTLEFRACVCLCIRALSIFQSFPPPNFSRGILRAVPSSSSVIQPGAVPCPPLRGCRRGPPRVYSGEVVRGDGEATLS